MKLTALPRAVFAQVRIEVDLTLRRGESVLVAIVIPAVLMVFFASARILPANVRSIAFLLPGTLALAIISSGLVSLGIATAYERYYGVLKQFGATPYPRAGLMAGKVLAIAMVEVVQIALLTAIASLVFGWRPHGSVPAALLVLILGSIAFAGLGMLMAGALRAEATLAGANGLFLFFLLLGGLYVPLSNLPGWLAAFAHLLPAAALADTLRAALGQTHHVSWSAAAVLLVWAVAAPLAAALTFKWE